MEQLTQNLKDGTMKLLEVPFPALLPGCVLVRNYYSLISAGTEGRSVRDARLGYIAKARARKEEVRKVFNAVKTNGLLSTYRTVMNRLEAPSPLGYSCAGVVIAVAPDVMEFRPGDHVACGGNTAVHSEVVSVPVNLCVHVDESVSLKHAAFTTVGAIALQGIRQADLRLGENCVVIGLGLIGQLTVQLLRAGGIRVAGIDTDEVMVQAGMKSGCEVAAVRNNDSLEELIMRFTGGHGADAVIITAGAQDTDPVNLAGALARRKGKVVVVGGVPTGFERKNYYRKELDLRMSSSYGPGRYDAEYEEKGIDYPYAYVRWTENRNMEAVAGMLKSGSLNLSHLVTHVFPFSDAPDAYEMILERKEKFTGILLEYDQQKELQSSVTLRTDALVPGEPAIGLIGTGSFAQSTLLPALRGVKLVSVASIHPQNARHVADRFGFGNCASSASDVISDPNVNTVFIATRHDSHARLVIESMKAGRHVFTEKPLCITEDELEEIKAAYPDAGSLLMTGFNRRFSPMIREVKQSLHPGIPVSILYRVNAGRLSPEHWVHDIATGGGRITGEVCHFIDTCAFLAGYRVVSVSAVAMKDAHNLDDTLTINLAFENGSIAAISYFSNGNPEVPKEVIEVYSGGTVMIVDDFRRLSVFGKRKSVRSDSKDKGHQACVNAFLDAVRTGKESPMSFGDIWQTTYVTFRVLESVSLAGAKIDI